MPSHIHMIIGIKKDKLEDIVRDMKKHSSMILKATIKNNIYESRKEWMIWLMERAGRKNSNNKDFQFWQQHNKPLEIKGQEMFDKMIDYIHQNPVAAGFVISPEYWKYSIARDFCEPEFKEGKGLIELTYE